MVDFALLKDAFRGIRQSTSKPVNQLQQALKEVIDYAHAHPARYRLLFSNPDIAAQNGDIEQAALMAFAEFAAIVHEWQAQKKLPTAPTAALSDLLYASLHGLIDLELSGRMRPAKGLSRVSQSINLLIQLLSPER